MSGTVVVLTLCGGLERVSGGRALKPSGRKVWKEASRQLIIISPSPATAPAHQPEKIGGLYSIYHNNLGTIHMRAVHMYSLKGKVYDEKCRELDLETLTERREKQDLLC